MPPKSNPQPLTHKQVQNIFFRRVAHNWIFPNFSPVGWFECDLFSVSKAGYFYEHEIKTSRSDFLNDQHKCRVVDGKERTKYDLLLNGHTKGPSQFYYLVPQDLLQPEDIPIFAGLKYILTARNNRLATIKQAPTLHRVKVQEEIVRQIQVASYYRFWNERQALSRLQQSVRLKT